MPKKPLIIVTFSLFLFLFCSNCSKECKIRPDLEKIGEKTVYIDADVIQADGGTRTTAITGAMVAVYDAVQVCLKAGTLTENPIREFLASVSVGIVNGQPVCDLNYEEDSKADVDMNLVMTESGKFVEVQGTAEQSPFSHGELNAMLEMGQESILSTINKIKTEVGVA
mgnify:CR=1 FL=1